MKKSHHWLVGRFPTREKILAHRALRRVRPWLDHAYLWHFSRHSAPGALAAGIVAAMLPPPLQTISAVFLAFKCRLHLPTALVGTLVTNPFTIVPIYWLAYELGALLLGHPSLHLHDVQQTAANNLSSLWPLLGWPWLLGLALLTATAAVVAYGVSRALWVCAIRWRWRRRQSRNR